MTDRKEEGAGDGPGPTHVVFGGGMRIAAGSLADAAKAAWRAQQEMPDAPVLVFDRETGRVVDLDLRGSEEEAGSRHASPHPPARRGRPKLGVVAREVTLLPRHWEWLAQQPGGASTALRKLVEAARKSEAGAARMRSEAAYRFMSTMAGDLDGFEEAARALFAGDLKRMSTAAAAWPPDILGEVLRLAGMSSVPQSTEDRPQSGLGPTPE